MFEQITPVNWVQFAMKHYENPQAAGEDEFYEDIKRFKYLKRLFKKHYDTGNLKERLILNHIIILGNVLGPDVCAKILMSKTDITLRSIVKTFLVYLNYLPENQHVEIPLDSTVIDVLRKL